MKSLVERSGESTVVGLAHMFGSQESGLDKDK
jgi:hypothetical protein